jgi:serine/threonine protein kinase
MVFIFLGHGFLLFLGHGFLLDNLNRDGTRARLSWCRQLLGALACLNSNNMVHRDVKPANVMVTKDLTTIKLVDYGLFREIRYEDDDTQCPVMTGQTGSFRYMAPEVVLESDYGLEVDIYSATMCAYYIIAGSARRARIARKAPPRPRQLLPLMLELAALNDPHWQLVNTMIVSVGVYVWCQVVWLMTVSRYVTLIVGVGAGGGS